jgi:hypothetical protein
MSFTTKDRYEVHLSAVYVHRIWDGLMEGGPSVEASADLVEASRLTGRVEQQLRCSAVVGPNPPSLLPDWEWMLHLRCREAVGAHAEHWSELVLVAYSDQIQLNPGKLAAELVPNIVWEEHALDHDISVF